MCFYKFAFAFSFNKGSLTADTSSFAPLVFVNKTMQLTIHYKKTDNA